MNVFEVLKKRGYIYQTSNDAAVKNLLSKPAVVYQGFDPTAGSFHVGHLVSFNLHRHLLNHGHRVIFLLGGGTGLVGDPTGKTKSREMLTKNQVERNAQSLEQQARQLLGGSKNIIFLNNADWLAKASLIDYLRKITPHISINRLLTHETYKQRIDRKLNLSLFEFLYSSLQAWDFLYLFEKYNCRLQIGGQDQWRNILDGVELVRKTTGEDVLALTFPLLTGKSGAKMGKSERGTVWLDPQKTPAFDLYQYWLNRPDEGLERDLKLFTLLDLEEIKEIMKKHPKKIQERLASEVTKLVHGAETVAIPAVAITKGEIGVEEILVSSKLTQSKSEARRLIEQGGVTFDEETGILKIGKSRAVRLI